MRLHRINVQKQLLLALFAHLCSSRFVPLSQDHCAFFIKITKRKGMDQKTSNTRSYLCFTQLYTKIFGKHLLPVLLHISDIILYCVVLNCTECLVLNCIMYVFQEFELNSNK